MQLTGETVGVPHLSEGLPRHASKPPPDPKPLVFWSSTSTSDSRPEPAPPPPSALSGVFMKRKFLRWCAVEHPVYLSVCSGSRPGPLLGWTSVPTLAHLKIAVKKIRISLFRNKTRQR